MPQLILYSLSTHACLKTPQPRHPTPITRFAANFPSRQKASMSTQPILLVKCTEKCHCQPIPSLRYYLLLHYFRDWYYLFLKMYTLWLELRGSLAANFHRHRHRPPWFSLFLFIYRFGNKNNFQCRCSRRRHIDLGWRDIVIYYVIFSANTGQISARASPKIRAARWFILYSTFEAWHDYLSWANISLSMLTFYCRVTILRYYIHAAMMQSSETLHYFSIARQWT